MILSSMSTRQRYDEVIEVCRRLSLVCRSGRILGGYPRDAVFGKDASDIDFWIPVRFYPSAERRARLVEELGDALGQYNFRNAATHVSTQDINTEPLVPPREYANQNTGVVEAYEAHPDAFINRGGFNKLQVIFIEQSNSGLAMSRFHVDICRAYVAVDFRGQPFAPEVTPSATDDFTNRRLTINSFTGQTPDRLLPYIAKLQRKFEGFRLNIRVQVDDHDFNSNYLALFNGGFLNAPRAILQTETQGIAGDSIRQQDRTTSRGQTVLNTIRGRERSFQEALQSIDEMATPRGTSTVLDETGVQTGLSGGVIGRTFWVAPEPTPVVRRG